MAVIWISAKHQWLPGKPKTQLKAIRLLPWVPVPGSWGHLRWSPVYGTVVPLLLPDDTLGVLLLLSVQGQLSWVDLLMSRAFDQCMPCITPVPIPAVVGGSLHPTSHSCSVTSHQYWRAPVHHPYVRVSQVVDNSPVFAFQAGKEKLKKNLIKPLKSFQDLF